MYSLLQLLLSVIAIYGIFNFNEELRLYVALGCLVSMLIVGRLDRERFEKKEARKNYLRSEMERIARKDTLGVKEDDLYNTNSLLWPKGELMLIDAVHYVLRDLGFKVAVADKNSLVDRILRIPNTPLCFGVQILMSDGEVEKDHPKIERALRYQEQATGKEKALIVASTHIRQPLSERENLTEISMELHEFLAGCQITLLTAHSLYQLWQESKAGKTDIVEVFQEVLSYPGGVFSLGRPSVAPDVSKAELQHPQP